MKPADRALEIVVVGLGQAGGNLAAEFSRRGYRSLALNTAHTDLASLAPGQRDGSLAADQRVYVGIDGYDGAGADLNYGRECIQENAERIREVVAAHADGADVVILAAGLGGGTGSAVSELVKVLQPLELPLVTLTTLPNEYESGIAKVNAVRAMSDLVKLKNIGWIFADNSRLAQVHGGISLDKYFEKINQVIIEPLDALNRLNDRSNVHPLRTLDGEDFRALLLSTGVVNYSVSVLPALSVDAVTERVRESMSANSMMPAGFSPEEVAYMGVVIEADEDVLANTPFSFFEQLSSQLKDETGGGALYVGVYRTDKPIGGGAALLRTICSTQSLPEGIQAIVNDARREGGTLRDKLARSISSLDLGEIEEFDLFKTSLRTSQPSNRARRRSTHPPLGLGEEELAIGNIVRPERTPSVDAPRSAPAPSAAAASPSAPSPQAAEEPMTVPPPEASETASEAQSFTSETSARSASEADIENVDSSVLEPADESADETNPSLDPTRQAEAANYAQLVATFLRTEFASTRRRVARGLQSARQSEDPITRDFAERAIERIRREGQIEAFEAALGESGSSSHASA